MVTTGYSDTFNRTVGSGLGSATSGQAYTLFGAASQFSVAPSQASIAISSGGDKLGYVDFRTHSIDITAEVALTSVPVTNLATVGFVGKLSTTSNYYNATMMVAAGGAVSLRFSKVVSGGLSTISTTAVTGLTYVANTFYNLRYSIFWSRPLQANVMSLKLWLVGTTEPGGWMATATDSSHTDYTSGTQFGIMGRDESSVVGTITTRHRNLVASSYELPMPDLTDPMCEDPAVTFPERTALESLADAADAAMTTIDPFVSIAELFPRVRVSNSNVTVNTASFGGLTYNATEFNVGTDTNLGFDNAAIYLPVGIWLIAFEIRLAAAASDYLLLLPFGGPASGQNAIDFRSNPTQNNNDGVGGTGHLSALTFSTDPTTPIRYGVSLSPNNLATTYTIQYVALSAVKVSDYFT
jgi:hypothetical protein